MPTVEWLWHSKIMKNNDEAGEGTQRAPHAQKGVCDVTDCTSQSVQPVAHISTLIQQASTQLSLYALLLACSHHGYKENLQE